MKKERRYCSCWKYKTRFDVNSTKMDRVSERTKVTKEKEGRIKNLLNCWKMNWKRLQEQLSSVNV